MKKMQKVHCLFLLLGMILGPSLIAAPRKIISISSNTPQKAVSMKMRAKNAVSNVLKDKRFAKVAGGTMTVLYWLLTLGFLKDTALHGHAKIGCFNLSGTFLKECAQGWVSYLAAAYGAFITSRAVNRYFNKQVQPKEQYAQPRDGLDEVAYETEEDIDAALFGILIHSWLIAGNAYLFCKDVKRYYRVASIYKKRGTSADELFAKYGVHTPVTVADWRLVIRSVFAIPAYIYTIRQSLKAIGKKSKSVMNSLKKSGLNAA